MPTGTVTFLDGSTVLGTGTLNETGTATYTTTAFTLAAGSHSITAIYSGDNNYTASTSTTRSETVSQEAMPAVVGSPGSGTPTGTPASQNGGSTFTTGPGELATRTNPLPAPGIILCALTPDYATIQIPDSAAPSTLPSTQPAKTAADKSHPDDVPEPRLPRPSGTADAAPTSSAVRTPTHQELQTTLLWKQLNERARQVEAKERTYAVDAVFTASLSAVASVGVLVWNTQYGYMLFSALTARPLWKGFDALAVLQLWEKQGQKKRPKPSPLSQEEDEEVLEPLFG